MEIFFDVVGYERYSVSNTGRVRNNETGRILKPSISSCGNYVVGLRRNNISRTIPVQRLVAERYIPNPYDFKYIEHKDGNKLNNDISNLRWVETYSKPMKASTKTKHKLVKTLTELSHILMSIIDNAEGLEGV